MCLQALNAVSAASAGFGIGIDMEDVATFTDKGDEFLARNFTEQEIAYCK